MNLFESLDQHSGRVALFDSNMQSVSFEILCSYSDKCVEQIPTRSVVFLLCRNDVESIFFYVGMIRKGIVPLLLSHDMTKENLFRLIEAFNPNFIIGNTEHLRLEFPQLAGVEFQSYSILDLNPKRQDLNPDLALLLTTSGSTGSPSLVCLSNENLFENANAIISGLQITSEDRAITTLPMNYSYGLSIINTHLISGASLVLNNNSVMERSFWDLIQRHSPSSLGGVPYTYELLTRFNSDFFASKSIRTFTQAGGKLDPKLVAKMIEYCEDIGARFFVMYGQTEATARMSIATLEELKYNPSTVGRPIIGTRFEIRDENDKPILNSGVKGELIFEGKNVSLGTAENFEQLRSATTKNQILRTGDIAHFDNKGLFYIDGRLKRFAKLFGHRINLQDVELFLNTKSINSVAFSFQDIMVIATEGDVLSDDIRNELVTHLKTHSSAVKTFTVESFPRSPSGKMMYRELEELYERGTQR